MGEKAVLLPAIAGIHNNETIKVTINVQKSEHDSERSAAPSQITH